ncbi:type II toxin-antitoxin system HicB family antitoxin [Patescibacteria group bacterium]
MLTYTVELKPQKEGGYTVTAPALPGCISEGDTLEEALENIKDAVEGYIQVMAKHNRKIPMEFSEFHQIEVFKKKSLVRQSRLKSIA